jgi:aspartate-semialdehyde dehydrogenase
VARETGKILGRVVDGAVTPASFPVSATCTRAAVSEGHTEAVTVSLGAAASPAEVADAFREFDGGLGHLPSAPRRLITVHDDPFRPQPRLDRDADGGMTTSVGRIRADSALEHGVKYVLVSHNTKMGAAKGAVLTAEWLVAEGRL